MQFNTSNTIGGGPPPMPQRDVMTLGAPMPLPRDDDMNDGRTAHALHRTVSHAPSTTRAIRPQLKSAVTVPNFY
jgi:hypothetical protein